MAAVYPAGPEPMTMTLRVVPIPSPPPFRCAPGSGRCASYLEDFGEVREVADLVARRCDPRRERHAVRIDPRGVHADLLRPEHVDLGAVADEERLAGSNPETAERLVEDRALGLPPADGVGDDDRAEKAGDALALENVHGGRRVVEVRDDRQPVPVREALEQRPVMAGKLGGLPELGPVRVDQRLAEARRQRGRVEREATEEVAEPLRGRNLAVVDRAQPLGLAPALDERLVTRLEGDPGGVSAEDRVEVARRGAHRPPAHLLDPPRVRAPLSPVEDAAARQRDPRLLGPQPLA